MPISNNPNAPDLSLGMGASIPLSDPTVVGPITSKSVGVLTADTVDSASRETARSIMQGKPGFPVLPPALMQKLQDAKNSGDMNPWLHVETAIAIFISSIEIMELGKWGSFTEAQITQKLRAAFTELTKSIAEATIKAGELRYDMEMHQAYNDFAQMAVHITSAVVTAAASKYSLGSKKSPEELKVAQAKADADHVSAGTAGAAPKVSEYKREALSEGSRVAMNSVLQASFGALGSAVSAAGHMVKGDDEMKIAFQDAIKVILEGQRSTNEQLQRDSETSRQQNNELVKDAAASKTKLDDANYQAFGMR